MNLNIVLDTTFVLPLFGIEINIDNQFLVEIRNLWAIGYSNCDFVLPNVCLIEAMYKLISLYKKTSDPANLLRYSTVVPTILTCTHIKIMETYLETSIVQIALKLREAGHPDMFDCLIGAVAVVNNGILITEDCDLVDIIKQTIREKAVICWNWAEFRKHWKEMRN